jgi:hypothetical protein
VGSTPPSSFGRGAVMHVLNQLFLFLQLKPTCWLFEDDLERQ